MQDSQRYIASAASHTRQALGRMPIRSSLIARQMIKEALPVPETQQDIEHYLRDLLSEAKEDA